MPKLLLRLVVPVALGVEPSVPPPPWKKKRPFQLLASGSWTWKPSWYWQLSTGLKCLLTMPVTMQRCGRPPPAGVSTADTITVLGTGKPAGGSAASAAHGRGVTGVAIDVDVVEKPAHWPCACPSTQLGPRNWVGSGELSAQLRFPSTRTRLTSEALAATFEWMWALPPTRPSQATQGPALDWHSKLPRMTMSGP